MVSLHIPDLGLCCFFSSLLEVKSHQVIHLVPAEFPMYLS